MLEGIVAVLRCLLRANGVANDRSVAVGGDELVEDGFVDCVAWQAFRRCRRRGGSKPGNPPHRA